MSRRMTAIVVGVVAMAAGVGSLVAADSFDPANATYEFAGDTFTLADGKAQIMGHSGMDDDTSDTMIPVGYTLAASAAGDLGGGSGEAVALYRGFGANLQWVILFGFEEEGGTYKQVAASPVYQEDSSVESVSVDNGTVAVELLVVSEADKELPHYEQKPTQPLTLNFTMDNGAFVAAQ